MKKSELRQVIREAIFEFITEQDKAKVSKFTQQNRPGVKKSTTKNIPIKLTGSLSQQAKQLRRKLETDRPDIINLLKREFGGYDISDPSKRLDPGDKGNKKTPLKGSGLSDDVIQDFVNTGYEGPPMIEFLLSFPPMQRDILSFAFGWVTLLPLGVQAAALTLVLAYVDEWFDGDGNWEGFGEDGFISNFFQTLGDWFNQLFGLGDESPDTQDYIDNITNQNDQDGDGIPDSGVPDSSYFGLPDTPLFDADGNLVWDPNDFDLDGIANDGTIIDYDNDPAYNTTPINVGDIDFDNYLDMSQFDNDNDGISDFDDPDDDNDGIPDVGPDGIAGTDDDDDINVFGNNDYVDPNDLDGDGILNQFDDDIDGDGILNQNDSDVDGDGIDDLDPSSPYGDDDGDGIPNINDTDSDLYDPNPGGTGDSGSDGDGFGIGGPSLPDGFGSDGPFGGEPYFYITDDEGNIVSYVDPNTGMFIDCTEEPDSPGCFGDPS
tara:strand:- start:96 stop:1562 length:1467 start_codon:yes stop_codon:yes gene_type:complete